MLEVGSDESNPTAELQGTRGASHFSVESIEGPHGQFFRDMALEIRSPKLGRQGLRLGQAPWAFKSGFAAIT